MCSGSASLIHCGGTPGGSAITAAPSIMPARNFLAAMSIDIFVLPVPGATGARAT